jgi:hypothetical protein
VGAEYAELAEVALLLTGERPQAGPSFAERMDERVSRRFAQVPPPAAEKPRRSVSRFWQAAGALTAGVAVIVGIVIAASGPNGSSMSSSSAASTASSGGSSAGGAASSAAAGSSAQRSAAAPNGAEKSAASAPAATTASGSAAGTPAESLQPPTTGRKIVQSAQLELAAAPNRIDNVAQQVYNVIGQLNGIVERSTITQTGGLDGSASFQLSVPSASLGQAMSQLSSLHYASVLSRTDASQDITDQYGAAKRALSDARALRTSLLKQLANATTTEQIDSLKAQIRDAEASISSDEATLARLNHQVGFSQLSLEISARTAPPPAPHHSGGFGIGRAAHDAGRVLTVAAGVALIVLAALVPVALVAALLWWVGSAVRRRRREQALDST